MLLSLLRRGYTTSKTRKGKAIICAHANVLDSIHDRCYPKRPKKAICHHLISYLSRRNQRVAMPRFFAVVVSGLVLNTAIMASGIETLHLHYLFSQILAIVLVLFWNFGGSRFWAF
jgi:hypothetical protein